MRVSVVIPVKDDALRLETCLEALAVQTVAPAQIVVVDNGSSDITPEVARWWSTTYVREDRPGIPAAASAGYDAATGDVIARLDADSVPPPEWVAQIAEVFSAENAPDAVTGAGQFTALSGVPRRAAQLLYMEAYFAVFGRILGHPPVFGSAFAMTRDAWLAARDQVQRDDAELHDDLDLAFHLPPDVRRSADLDLPVSSRPFSDPVAFLRRIRRGVHTVAVNARA